ncbi:hypothetical protein MM26B8_05360 [Mycoplasmopsis meleagridis]|uniref:Uncharacterized protein n=1 Tax=Mycoplasmopsis meleagridis ATCC 25294 TaxID=1264554 RepID=A0A0F5H1C5_9BACT|nr:hypothetical protein [Mycoplasmopsis meleagridis]KKB26657.1 hypothetical protein MMELEA_00390 [Mycoplasmopsis meleagridis ATCC 25294]OAD18228.1 hypothetical protein MM26B8_05360 [Mycoplasmopsis meleagridis]VEU77711.1 Uncharacterised protein [Mycoplasmopsis meleagridis]
MKLKLTPKKKILISFVAVGAIVSIALPVALTSTKTKLTSIETDNISITNNKNNKNFESNRNIINYDIFPNIKAKQFYEYIRINNGETEFDINVIPAFMKYVVNNFKYSQGYINFDYKIKENKDIDIYVKWINNDEELSRTYTLSIEKKK